MKPDLWHFPRRLLAKKFIDLLEMGLANRLTLVAPRRKGKTEFLIHDVAPAAVKAGYRVVYASLWGDVNAPQKSLISDLSNALEAHRARNRNAAKEVLGAAVNRLKISALSVGAELEFAHSPVPVTHDELAQIDALIRELNKGAKTKVLLILDEIQHIGTHDAFKPLAYRLKTTLDTEKDVRVMFSGSSRSGIRRLFGDLTAPLYGVSTEVQLDDLDRSFTDFLVKVYQKVSKREISPDALWRTFEKLDKNPFYVRESLKLMALEPGLSTKAAVTRLLDAVAEQNNYSGRWIKMSAIDQALFLRIANHPNQDGLHSKKNLEVLKIELGKTVSANLVARRLQRLVDQNFISPTQRGTYMIEVPGFAEWVRRNEGSAKTRRLT